MKSPILFQNQPAIEIRDDSNRVVISPDHGARILCWETNGRQIIRWPAEADWTQILKVRGGNPILFPFIARHFVDGRPEVWRDSAGVIRPMPQHGFARDAQFALVEDNQVDEADSNQVRLRLTNSERTSAMYPFSFQFDVVISLLPDSELEVRFETTNQGTDPLPYYAGHHFYFAIPHDERGDWTSHLPCQSWGRQNPDGSIAHEIPTSERLCLGDPALIDRFQIGPQSNEIIFRNTRSKQQLIFKLVHAGSIPWYAITTWSQTPESDFYCLEPWLGLPNAIHHGEGLRRLAPGKMETATCVIKASGW